LKWQFENPVPRPPEQAVLDQELPVLNVEVENLINPPADNIQAIWLGHATFLIQMDGITILTDPVFCERASPFGFIGPSRLRPVPIPLEKIPKIDIVLVSHNHYDHLDADVVKKLKNVTWVVPKLMKKWFKWTTKEKVVELDWWDQYTYSPEIDIIFTPCMHWSKRTLTDNNQALWGSFLVKSSKRNVYFSGDTGYCDVFKQVGEKLGPIDLALIPIGAYEPAIHRPQHVNPEEAVLLHRDIKSKKSIGMHWGTFILTSEPIFQPRTDLLAAVQKHGLGENEFITVNIGQNIII
jgi:N-acyl-phosphatidylethanolamine-hydrolysing phospholipase D